MRQGFYPPSPTSLPAGFTAPTMRYRLQVALVLAGLALFIALYGSAIAGTAWLILQLPEIPIRGRGVWVLFGAAAVLLFLLAFFIKGFFHTRRRDLSDLVEITREEQPRLFAFIDGLVGETGAPSPKRVYLSPDVNAAVFYDTSFLSLFLPVRKNLLIGLGLVNALNVSELKGVLGHELGHFAQSSMRVGAYVYIANGIIHDLVWGRDRWDDALDAATRVDVRIAVFAWILAGIVWALRRVRGGG
jgi:Zn-dependent protease with chaperone function